MTRMVGEFPELQGVDGPLLRRRERRTAEVAAALDELLPAALRAATRSPPIELGQVLAVAERLDTLAGIFAVGMKPTRQQGSVCVAPRGAGSGAHPDRRLRWN